MSFLSRLLGRPSDDRAAVRPLWHRTVALARDPEWYARLGVSDTLPGRFDAVTLVLALVMLRMERDETLIAPSALLTELFVEDMDGQLRESGVGDLGVGKKMGRLMSVLGGRIGALRDALPLGEAAVAEVITRNVTLIDGAAPLAAARRALALAATLNALSADELLAGEFSA